MILSLFLSIVTAQSICQTDCCHAIKAWNFLKGTSIDEAEDCCQMEGVGCSEGLVQEIYWNSTESSGVLPEELGFLEDLKILDLSSNALEGEIPQTYYEFPALEILRLKNNSLAGCLGSFKHLTSLRALDLSSNQFSGEISEDSFKDLQEIQFINFGGNPGLTGLFPTPGPKTKLM